MSDTTFTVELPAIEITEGYLCCNCGKPTLHPTGPCEACGRGTRLAPLSIQHPNVAFTTNGHHEVVKAISSAPSFRGPTPLPISRKQAINAHAIRVSDQFSMQIAGRSHDFRQYLVAALANDTEAALCEKVDLFYDFLVLVASRNDGAVSTDTARDIIN